MEFTHEDLMADLGVISLEVCEFEPIPVEKGVVENEVEDFLNGKDDVFEESQAQIYLNAYETFKSSTSVLQAIHERSLVEEACRLESVLRLPDRIRGIFGEKPALPSIDSDTLNTINERYAAISKQLETIANDYSFRLAFSGAQDKDVVARWDAFASELEQAANKKEFLDSFVSHMYDSPLKVSVEYFKQAVSKTPLSLVSNNILESQMAKDLERDTLVCNGKLFVGAETGYLGIWHAIHDMIHDVHLARYRLASANENPSATPSSQEQDFSPFESLSQSERKESVEGFVANILHAANRTQSGGDTFEILDSTFCRGEDALAVLVPESQSAAPLNVEIDCGPYKEHSDFGGGWSWGVRARVAAPLTFSICDRSPEDESSATWAQVTGRFERLLVLPLTGKTFAYDRGLTDMGIVCIEMTMP
eukprot:Stramenopile-MAST_4_protein_1252